MKAAPTQLSIPLSQLVPSRRNPRKVKPGREAHHRLVALIRSQGLLQPLLIRPMEGKPKRYEIVAGERRLKALQEIHRGNGDPKIPCVLREVDTATADALSLGENFAREAMHALDEAEAFDRLSRVEGKDAEMIAADFGVTEHYVRQRAKLASLAGVVKSAYREGTIDTSIAEALSAVPADRQELIWKELNGQPRHAEQVRRIIASAWIDASFALFDLSKVPEHAVTKDLFNEKILVERTAFMRSQTEALEAQKLNLVDQGWKHVVAGNHPDLEPQIQSMDEAPREYDKETAKKLDRINERRQKLDAKFADLDDDNGPNDAKAEALSEQIETLDDEARQIVRGAPVQYAEETKAIGTVFLVLDPSGEVRTHHRLPRVPVRASTGEAGGALPAQEQKIPSSEDLSDRQLATTFTHLTLAVRQALLKDAKARKRILVLILHEKVRSEALAIRHEANGVTLHADHTEDFQSPALTALRERRAKVDPFAKQPGVNDCDAYTKLSKFSEKQLDALIDVLTVQLVDAHMLRRTKLVEVLAEELKIDVPRSWRPDAKWLSSYQKIQLAHLVTELKGAVHAPAPERKKSELIELLAKLFADAAEGKLEDKQLADRVNRWLPSNLRKEDTEKQNIIRSRT